MSVQRWGESLIVSQVDGATITAAAATSMLPAQAKWPLPAGFFDTVGKKLVIEAYGRVSAVITNPGTARFDVRLGGTVVFDSLAIALATVDAYTNQGWRLRISLTCRAVGTVGNLMGQGSWESMNIAGAAATPPKGSLMAMLPWNTAPAVGGNFDTTIAQIVDVFFTQTVATGSLTCHQYELISPN